MKQERWQSAFGAAPEAFHDRLCETLNDLEEKDMKKRTKMTTVLLAAALMVALLAGTAVAAREFGLFDFLKTANPIVPLEGAEAMIVKDVGTAENEYVRLTIEEAVYDGQGALIQLRYTAKEPEKYALLHGAMDWLTDDYIYEHEEYEDGTGMYSLVGRKDGRTILHVGGDIRLTGADGSEIWFDTWDAWEDGKDSIVIQGSGFAEDALPEQATLRVESRMRIGDTEERQELEPITVQMQRSTQERRVQLIPTGETEIERFRFLSGELNLTPVRGYMSVRYAYQPVPEEDMGVTIKLYDGDGNEINLGSGGGEFEKNENGWEINTEYSEMQSFDELPEIIFVEAKVIGEARTLGRVECRTVE